MRRGSCRNCQPAIIKLRQVITSRKQKSIDWTFRERQKILFRAGINFVNVKIKATSLSVNNVHWTSWIALDSMKGYSAILLSKATRKWIYGILSLNQPRPISNSYLRKWISQTNWHGYTSHSFLNVVFKQYETVHLLFYIDYKIMLTIFLKKYAWKAWTWNWTHADSIAISF